jgi:GNAT superfamily N-acetyltransferase
MGINQDQLIPPEKLNSLHQIESFNSGNSQLDDWLKRRAFKNETEGASRTYILCTKTGEVVGYCSLANGAIAQTAATGRVKRNMPDPIPVMVIGRLAIDQSWQGQGIAKALLRDVILRVLQAAEIAGIRAILVHAISVDAKHFYKKCGFVASPVEPMTLMLKISDAIIEISSP